MSFVVNITRRSIMGKRTYLTDSITMGLLYREKYTGTQRILYDDLLEYDSVINQNLEERNPTVPLLTKCPYYEQSKLFLITTDETQKKYAVIRPEANLEEAWNTHIGCLPLAVVIASQMPNALEKINLELVNGILREKVNKEPIKILKRNK